MSDNEIIKALSSMTDNEFIKALECCAKGDCSMCPLNYGSPTCIKTLVTNALDLINRQKAEIERLREYEEIRPIGCPNCSRGNFSNSKYCSHCGTQLQGKKNDIRAEAIKEFAERLKKHFETYADDEESNAIYMRNLIDDLVEEMTEKGGE